MHGGLIYKLMMLWPRHYFELMLDVVSKGWVLGFFFLLMMYTYILDHETELFRGSKSCKPGVLHFCICILHPYQQTKQEGPRTYVSNGIQV